ncbi:DUF6049 family protein [Pseudonocardia spinosispora]|uniref:DUF6049 family protein n=1 Tax=Pseudonocardia spinosispora TaxID=103441 RepID=UPI0003FAD623|nr:DUF6049 family protein [Pseudonocardia spinosispora]
MSTLIALAVLTVGLLSLTASGHLSGSVADAAPSPDATARPRAPVAPVGSNPIQLRIDSMSPRVVTSTGPGELTVTGMLTNAGDQPVGDVEVRAQRSDRLRTDGDLRTALSGDAADDAITPSFTRLADELAPGQQVPIELTVPLRGTETASLALQRTGIYDLLINVNGVPAGGDQARLAGVHALLPVLGLPAVGGRAAETTPAEPAGAAQPVSVLYPIADQPRRLPTGPAEPVLLGDDQLGTDLAKGGRLDGLLDALEAGAPAGSPMHQAVCLAIDPDLLRTVSDMAGPNGYRVRGPNGAEVDGRGATAANTWLNRLRTDAAGRCVMALPYADADIVALSRAGLGDMTAYATRGGARIVADVLRTQVRTDATWPADGLLDERSLTDFARAGGRTVVLSADAVSSGKAARGATGGTVRLSAPGSTTVGLLTDPLVSLAASGPPSSEDRTLTSRLSSVTGSDPVNPTGSGGTLSDQNTIGAVAYRALGTASASTPLLVAPPHQWHTTGADAKELLGSIATLVTSGRLVAAPLGGAATEGAEPAGTAASLVYPLRAGAREVPTSVTTRLRDDRNATEQLRAAAVALPGVGSTPDQVFNPVTEGILRAGSAVWRGRGELSEAATKVITDRVRLLRSLVRVLEPPSPYALGDKEAPLPITLSNGLPVGMQVRVQLSDTPGLRIASMTPDPLPPIPPMGRLQVKANAQLNKSGTFSVEARLTTRNGVVLGTPSRLQLRSTVYGTVTLWLTGIAFVLLVVLAMRRIIRRIRGGNSEEDRRARTAPSEPTPAEPTPAEATPAEATPAEAVASARSMSGPATISTPISAVAEPGPQPGPPRGARIRGPVGPARSINPVARNNLLGYPNQPPRGSTPQGPVRGLPGNPAQNVPPPTGRPPRAQNQPPRSPAQGPVRSPMPPPPAGPARPRRVAPGANGQQDPNRQPNPNGRPPAPPAGENRATERPDTTGAAQAPDRPDTDQPAQQGGKPRARRNPEKTMPVHRTRQ